MSLSCQTVIVDDFARVKVWQLKWFKIFNGLINGGTKIMILFQAQKGFTLSKAF